MSSWIYVGLILAAVVCWGAVVVVPEAKACAEAGGVLVQSPTVSGYACVEKGAHR